MSRHMPTKCDRCGSQLLLGEFRRFRFDIGCHGEKAVKWKTDEFRRYYCPECTRKAKAALIAFEKGYR